MAKKIIFWVLRIVPAAILLQTLFFKFSGAEESIFIFTTVGMEPWGRYLSGITELIAGICLLIPRYSWLGALLAVGVMAGAIFFHLTILGIEVLGDGGYLFILAIIVMVTSLIIIFIDRQELIKHLKKFRIIS